MEQINNNDELKKIRKACIKKYREIFNMKISKKIEENIFKYVINYINENGFPLNFDNNFKNIYLIKTVSIYNNINPELVNVKNNYLYNQIIANKIDLDKIAFMKPDELFPERWSNYISKKKAENNYLYREQKYAETDEFKCMKCKKRRCKYYTIQIRSCDEPETIKIECLNCGNKWNE